MKPGVVSCLVGYSGGMKSGPTYANIKDSTECLLIEYNPEVMSYRDILSEMMKQHSPYRPAFKRQYRSVIFYKNDEERKVANDFIDHMSKGRKVHTDIEPITAFYRAEEYHQDYIAKRSLR